MGRMMRRAGIALLKGFLILVLIFSSGKRVFGEEPGTRTEEASSWKEKLRFQVAEEDRMEGRAGHSDRVEAAMNKVMDQILEQTGSDRHHAPGPFGRLGTMQQMDQGFILGAAERGEEIVTPGGRCPSTAGKRAYDISAITVEITLNQWGDYHP